MKRVSADRYSTNEDIPVTFNLNTECASWTQAGHKLDTHQKIAIFWIPVDFHVHVRMWSFCVRELDGVLGVCDVCGSEKVRILFLSRV